MLKSTSGWKSNGNGTDAFGFSALPAGGYYGESFFDCGYYAPFWSSTEDEGGYAYAMSLDYRSGYASLYDHFKYFGFSVRCLRD